MILLSLSTSCLFSLPFRSAHGEEGKIICLAAHVRSTSKLYRRNTDRSLTKSNEKLFHARSPLIKATILFTCSSPRWLFPLSFFFFSFFKIFRHWQLEISVDDQVWNFIIAIVNPFVLFFFEELVDA